MIAMGHKNKQGWIGWGLLMKIIVILLLQYTFWHLEQSIQIMVEDDVDVALMDRFFLFYKL